MESDTIVVLVEDNIVHVDDTIVVLVEDSEYDRTMHSLLEMERRRVEHTCYASMFDRMRELRNALYDLA